MSEWQKSTLGQLAEVQTGPFGSQLKNEQYITGGTPVVTVEHIKDFLIEDFVYPSVTDEDKSRLKKYTLKPGDIVFSRVGSVDLSALVKKHQSGWLFSSRMLRVRVKKQLDTDFLSYYLRQPAIRQFIINISVGSTMPSINTEILKSLPIVYCSLEEQKQIAAVLTCLDRSISNLRRQNETLEAIAQTLFKHWFVDFEFPNADGKPYKSSGGEMRSSELGEIPVGWRVGTLGDVVKINAESISKDYQYKEIEYVDISSVGVGVLEGTTSYQLKQSPSRARRLVKHGDVIWSGVRPNRKSYLCISHPPKNLVVSTGFVTLTPDLIPSSYLYSWVTTDFFVNYLTLNASGSAYPAVKAEHFEIAEVLLPDKLTLSRFHAVIDPMREKIYQNSRQIQTLTQTRDTLLPKLMSGQLRIKP
ncbi:hypothetical protein B9T07_10505 [Limnospira fusiformis CCALA 023]